MTTTSTSTVTPEPTPPAARSVLLGHARTLGAIATELGLPDLARTIEADTRRRLDEHRVRAVVLGEIKQGKSTLINAILGADALPTGVTPTTGAVAAAGGAATTEHAGEGPHTGQADDPTAAIYADTGLPVTTDEDDKLPGDPSGW